MRAIVATSSIVAFEPETGALGVFIRTENFEEREQERGYLDRAVLEFMQEKHW